MTDASRKSLGERLRRERVRHHWTQEYLAAQIGGSAISVIRWEKGQVRPHADMLQALIALFGKPIETWGTSRARVWTIPYLRNLYFTGRERILARLHTILGEYNIVAVSQARALSGLGGIGKTQTALEYAYRYAEEYDLVLWVRADSREALVAQFAGLAIHFGLPNHAEADQHRLARAVKHWLETQRDEVWLLIFDNVEDIPLVQEFLPTRGNGAILLTTRLHAVGKHLRKIELDKLSLEEGEQFLLARLGATGEERLEVLPPTEREAAVQLCLLLDGLPLALDQAAAYIEERQWTLAGYLALYQQQRADLLRLGNTVDRREYPDSVATTWLLSFERVEQSSPVAADLLRFFAFLHPDTIPEELLLEGAVELGPHLQLAAEHPARLQEAISILLNFSLIRRHADKEAMETQPPNATWSIHRMVQAVIQDGLEPSLARLWQERVVRAVNAVFPQVAPQTWPQCERLLTQAVHATQLIEQYQAVGEETGRLLFETANYLRYRGRYVEAEPLYLRALRLREQQFGPEHPTVATTLGDLGGLYREQGQFAEAERLCQRALGIWEQQVEPEYAQVAAVLNNLAIICTSRGQFVEAEPLYLQELAICEQRLGPRHHDTARTLNNVGNLYCFQGKYAQAEPLYLRALDIWGQLGPEISRLAYPLDGLGALYYYQGKYAEAEQCYLRALSINEQQLGPEHPVMPYPLTGLANLYREQGRDVEAESLYLRALHIWEEQPGETHPESAGTLAGLAHLYARQGNYSRAEPLFRQVQRIFELQGVPEHYLMANVLNGLANLCREQHRYEEAEALYQRALGIREKTWGAEHPDTAETMYDRGRLREAQGTREEAGSWYQRALAVRERMLGAQHPKTRETRQRLSALLHAMGLHEEAAQLEPPQTRG